jgi:signal transduction histidine kinase
VRAAGGWVGEGAQDVRAAGVAGGHGLVGMGERVGLLGGRFRAGATGDGGFVVEAVIPLEEQGAL